MASVLGKRKSRPQKTENSVSEEEARAKLAKFFESSFKPLFPTEKSTSTSKTEEKEKKAPDSDADSWDGVSEDEDEEEDEEEEQTSVPVVEVVAHTDAYSSATKTLDKRESRAWLSSRPPVAGSDKPSTNTSKKGKTAAEEDAPSLLKNDLALQRLLSESHLFSSAAAKNGGPGDVTAEHTGRNRHLANDMRLQALGSKTSIHKQAKMPMSHRKGIQAAADDREAKRRREARENGIVLERPGAASLGKKAAKAKRKGPSRDIDAPAVGRLSGGMLKLSKRDIASIEGSGSRKGGTFTKRRRR